MSVCPHLRVTLYLTFDSNFHVTIVTIVLLDADFDKGEEFLLSSIFLPILGH